VGEAAPPTCGLHAVGAGSGGSCRPSWQRSRRPTGLRNPAVRFTRLGRLAAAGTLVVGAAFQAVAFALIPDFDDTVDRLDWIAAHPSRAEASKVFDLLAVPFLLGGVIVYVLLARGGRRAWPGRAGSSSGSASAA
jgi:hypothetical protein